ncbi:ATP-dependent nuclease, partial [Lutispora sp.]
KLIAKDDKEIIRESYVNNEKLNYTLKLDLSAEKVEQLYNYMNVNNPIDQGFTILAIEEPEAHIHPSLQRQIYKEIINDSPASVLLTTHSTHIASVSPINSLVHFIRDVDGSSLVKSAANLQIPQEERDDLERYIDASRGELYFGKGVILVEGIAEEYLVPRFAEILKMPLDKYGIVICNINSTNFKPYANLLKQLGIPFVIITDGDIYEKRVVDGKEKREYHLYLKDLRENNNYGYLGYEIIFDLITGLNYASANDIPKAFNEQNDFFQQFGFFVGNHTLEVDIMEACFGNDEAKQIICNVYNGLTLGGITQKTNFKSELDEADYWKCLNKIEGKGVGKGRFSQRLASSCIELHIPEYVKDAITNICQKVNESFGVER